MGASPVSQQSTPHQGLHLCNTGEKVSTTAPESQGGQAATDLGVQANQSTGGARAKPWVNERAAAGRPVEGAGAHAAGAAAAGDSLSPAEVGGYAQLELGKADNFLSAREPALEGVASRGEFLQLTIRADGNCFMVAGTLGALISAALQPAAEPLQAVQARFTVALQPYCESATPFSILPEELKNWVRTFMRYLGGLVDAKRNGAGEDLAAKIVRDLSKPQASETGKGGTPVGGAVQLYVELFRGMVLASRILAISTKPYRDQSRAFQDNLRTVSEATAAENGFDLRPGENLGVRLGLFRDGLNLENRLTRAVFDAAAREEFLGIPKEEEQGLENSPILRDAEGDIVVRAGILDHFDLWLRAESTAGRAIVKGLYVKFLNPEDGERETVRLLKLERDSRQATSKEDLHKIALQI